MMKIIFTVFSLLLLLIGMLWIGQGTGIVKWPTNSFMISQHSWAIRGAGLAFIGIAILVFTRRL